MDYNYVQFLNSLYPKNKYGQHERSSCSIEIFTTGSTWMLSFVNEPHIDTRDIIPPNVRGDLFTSLDKSVEKVEQHKRITRTVRDNTLDFKNHILQIDSVVGLGVP